MLAASLLFFSFLQVVSAVRVCVCVCYPCNTILSRLKNNSLVSPTLYPANVLGNIVMSALIGIVSATKYRSSLVMWIKEVGVASVFFQYVFRKEVSLVLAS